MNKIVLCGLAFLGMIQSALAAEHVWRYVDASSGQVTYSNVQVKGAKGEKVEIMAYPSAPSRRTSVSPAVSAPIPAEVLNQLQRAQRSGVLPTGLPPLPTLPGAYASPTAAPVVPVSRADATPAAPIQDEPKWAKEVAIPTGNQPAWAKDPFSGSK